jgi:Holliday junction resolvase RusA-like endonuclease
MIFNWVSLPGFLMIDVIPFPPQSNNQYTPLSFVKNGRRSTHMVLSKHVRQYKANLNSLLSRVDFNHMRSWVANGHTIGVDLKLNCTKETLFTKSDTIRKWDASNKIKAVHDCLSQASLVDDSIFFFSSVEKVYNKFTDIDYVSLEIYPHAIEVK